MQSVIQSLQQGLATFFSYIPQLIGAIIILQDLGYDVAKVLQAITTGILRGIGFEGWMGSAGGARLATRS